MDTHEQLIRELDDGALPDRSDGMHRRAHRIEDGPCRLEVALLSPGHDRQRCADGALHSAGYGGVEVTCATLRNGGGGLAGERGADGARLDEHLPCPRVPRQTVRAEVDAPRRGGVRQARADDVSAGRDLCERGGFPRSGGDQFVDGGTRARRDDDVESSAHEVERHGLAHASESYESDGGGHWLPLVSQRLPR